MPEKTSFKINGLQSKEEANLIGENLRNQPGVVHVSVDFSAEHIALEYEPNAISRENLVDIIKMVGDYTLTEVKSDASAKVLAVHKKEVGVLINESNGLSSKNMFIFGLAVGLSVFSLLLNIVFAWMLFGGGNFLTAKKTVAVADTADNKPNPTVQVQPAPELSGPEQDFQISKNDHVRGDFNAPVTLVEFSDFECPYCGRHYPTMKSVLEDYPGKVRLVYKHFPLSFHANSQKAAEASECASEQGKFWEYHDTLFEKQQNGYSVGKFKQWAGELGLQQNKFDDCLDSGKYADKVKTDEQEGQSKGVNGTPATFVNGRLVSGALPYDSFKQIIDSLN